jgi:hypothetical protein
VSNEIKKAAEVINTFFSGIDSSKMMQANSFIRSWNDIVGEKISAHSKVIDVDNGTVIVEVEHTGWSQFILLKKRQIISDLSSNYPELKIKNVIIRVVSDCKTPYKKAESNIGEGVPRKNEITSTSDISVTQNEELKGIFEKLKKSIQKGKPQ